jgi:hypothetical protein
VKHLEESVALLTDLAAGDPDDNTAVRDVASARSTLAQTHDDLARRSLGEETSSHQRLAEQNRAQAIAALRQLEVRGVLSKFDRKSLAEMENSTAAPR